MADNNRVLTGLPNLPNEQIDPKLYPEFMLIYRAIQNLLDGISQYTGIDQPDAAEVAVMDPTQYLQGAQLNSWYPTCGEAAGIVRGQVVKVSATGTSLLAQATAASGVAIGVADETAALGVRHRVHTQGLITSITGMTTGTLYYLSTTLGAIQNLRPVGVGQIVQGLGWAMSANQMLLLPSTYFEQL